jgi:hypothetical protein
MVRDGTGSRSACRAAAQEASPFAMVEIAVVQQERSTFL